MSSEQSRLTEDGVVRKAVHSKDFLGVFVLWLPMTIIGVLLGIYATPKLMPGPAAANGHDAILTVQVFTVAAAPVAALVFAIAIHAVLVGRHKPADPSVPNPDGAPLRGNTMGQIKFIVVWLAGSVLLVVFLLVWGITEWSVQQDVKQGGVQINVEGQQWIWTYNYPGTPVTSNQLVLPYGSQVTFNVTSFDVTHGFWPVAMGIQVDANPGVSTQIHTTVNRMGNFIIRCSQLCGLNHAYMYTIGKVVTTADYVSWLESHGATKAQAEASAGMNTTQGGTA
jgi:cytochrome c oxidase subunit II